MQRPDVEPESPHFIPAAANHDSWSQQQQHNNNVSAPFEFPSAFSGLDHVPADKIISNGRILPVYRAPAPGEGKVEVVEEKVEESYCVWKPKPKGKKGKKKGLGLGFGSASVVPASPLAGEWGPKHQTGGRKKDRWSYV